MFTRAQALEMKIVTETLRKTYTKKPDDFKKLSVLAQILVSPERMRVN